ncbi:MAG: metallophosphoesterase [Candidatus Binatia bacterium]
MSLPKRTLSPPRRMTGRERRWIDPDRGVLKLTERTLDRFAERYVYPYVLGIWSPYSWLLPRRFSLAEGAITPPLWPRGLQSLRILLVSDIHTGAFLRPEILESILREAMRPDPDIVAVTGDVVEGAVSDLDGFLPALSTLTSAPLGAWYCFGNHDYYTRAAEAVGERLRSAGLQTLRNESVVLDHHGGAFVVGGIDDRLMGKPDWERLVGANGPPHLLLAHNPDDFYEAVRHGVALVVSGHTHGGQIRFPKGPPIVRQSRFCLDEGLYVHESTMLAVTRGLGAVGLPWRAGALPEAVLLRVTPQDGGAR